MKQKVTTFVSMRQALKELGPFICDGNHLETGKPFKNFDGMRSREVLGNWLLCAALNSDYGNERLRVCSDPNGGDGVINDEFENRAIAMEHVLVSRSSKAAKDTESLLIDQINKKREKGGKAYATGKTLVVFLNRKGENWIPRSVASKMPEDFYFDDIWVVGLNRVINGEYIYNVVNLDKNGCPIWEVKIFSNFEG